MVKQALYTYLKGLHPRNLKKIDKQGAFHDKEGNVKQSFFNFATIIVGILTVILVIAFENLEELYVVAIMFVPLLLLMLVFNIVIMVRQYKDCIEVACSYETYFCV